MPKYWNGTHSDAGFMFKRHGTVTNLTLVERYLIKTVGTDAVVGFGGETEAAFQQPVRYLSSVVFYI